jgi:hypothetical protein
MESYEISHYPNGVESSLSILRLSTSVPSSRGTGGNSGEIGELNWKPSVSN